MKVVSSLPSSSLSTFPKMRGMCSKKFMELLRVIHYFNSSNYKFKKVYDFFKYSYNIENGRDELYELRLHEYRNRLIISSRNIRYRHKRINPNIKNLRRFNIDFFYKQLDKSNVIKSGYCDYNYYKIGNTIKYNFLDVSEDGKYITYIPFDNKNPESWIVGDSELVNSKRQKIKIGRFIKYIFNFNNKVIEEFVSVFKSFSLEEGLYFETLKGHEIIEAYKKENLVLLSALGKSCMNDKPNFFFDIYCKNPNQISLLILRNKRDNKILGRSLLWELSNGKILMDRIYYSDEYIRKKFWNYCLEKKYINSSTTKGDFEIKLDYFNCNFYPYLDTFKFFYKFDGRLLTDFNDLMAIRNKLESKNKSKFKLFLLKVFKKKQFLDHKNKIEYTNFLRLSSTDGRFFTT